MQLGANGTRVLHALGLKRRACSYAGGRLRQAGAAVEHRQTWTTFDLSAVSQERYGAPHIFMHRGDLHAALADAIRRERPDAIRLGCRFAGLTQSDGGVTMTFADGEAVEGALAIGADGIRSPVRAALFGPERPSSPASSPGAGSCRWLALPPHLADRAATNWLGPAGICCIIRCGAAR